MRILVTGCGGFVGPWVARELAAAGHTVVGASLDPWQQDELEGGRAQLADLEDERAVAALFAHARAEAILQLAALSHVGESWAAPARYIQANTIAAANIFSAASRAGVRRVVFVSSSDVYGVARPEELPLRETSPERPASPYAVSKFAAEKLLAVMAGASRTSLTIARPFSHTGPTQTTRFVCPAFAEQVALVEAGRVESVRHGDLSAKRDFLDVRDVARAYRLLLEGDFPNRIFNIASGRAVAVREILDALLRIANLPADRAEPDPARARTHDLPELRGDASVLRAATGWEPRIPLEQTLRDLLEHHRARIAAGAAEVRQ